MRRCVVFDQLDCLHAPERRPDLKSFAVVVSERTSKGKTTIEHRFYLSGFRQSAKGLSLLAMLGHPGLKAVQMAVKTWLLRVRSPVAAAAPKALNK